MECMLSGYWPYSSSDYKDRCKWTIRHILVRITKHYWHLKTDLSQPECPPHIYVTPMCVCTVYCHTIFLLSTSFSFYFIPSYFSEFCFDLMIFIYFISFFYSWFHSLSLDEIFFFKKEVFFLFSPSTSRAPPLRFRCMYSTRDIQTISFDSFSESTSVSCYVQYVQY
jgi:hypothetical protein